MSSEITLDSLVGEHELSGVSFDNISASSELSNSFDDSSRCTFILDNVAYQAIEDPDDGYRSSLRDLLLCDASLIQNQFEPIPVFGVMRGASDDVIDFCDRRNGKVILSIGTANTDDCYPWFEATWTPENIA